TDSAPRAHEGERRLIARGRHLERAAATRLREGAAREECAPPRCHAGGLWAADDRPWQPLHRPSRAVDQPGAAGDLRTALDPLHDVARALAQVSCADDLQLRLVVVELLHKLHQTSRRRGAVHLGLHHDLSGDQMQRAAIAQQRCHLGVLFLSANDADAGDLVLHIGGESHGLLTSFLFTLSSTRVPRGPRGFYQARCFATMSARAAASFLGLCRSVQRPRLSSSRTSAQINSAPIDAAARSMWVPIVPPGMVDWSISM